MTEAEWQACTDPVPMLEFMQGKASNRKLRLLACACCRRIWHLLTDERCRRGVEVAEAFADGGTTGGSLGAAYLDVLAACQAAMRGWGLVGGSDRMQIATKEDGLAYDLPALATAVTKVNFDAIDAVNAALGVVMDSAIPANLWSTGDGDCAAQQAADKECTGQVELLRDIVGNPFRPVSINSSWLACNTSSVVKPGELIYDDRAFNRLPVLADSLEKAGCQSADILAHCRGAGPHVRGCWVIDLLLGKE